MGTRAKDMSKAEQRHQIDVHVGKQLVALRLAAGQNQSEIGRVLGLTFQQIQKYERGANRMSASVLATLADHFGVSVERFFEGREPVEGDFKIVDMAQTKNGQKLAALFAQMDPAQQKTLLMTAQAFVPAQAAA